MAMDQERYRQTSKLIQDSQSSVSNFVSDPDAMNAQLLINNLKAGVIVEPQVFFDSGISFDHRDPETGGTLLHIAAACGVRSIFHLALKHDGVD